MSRGGLFRIIIVILIIGMGIFLFVRNQSLKNQQKQGTRTDITIKDFLPFGGNITSSKAGDIINNTFGNNSDTKNENVPTTQNLQKIFDRVAGARFITINDEIAGPTGKDKQGNDTFATVSAVRYVAQENGFVYDYIPKYKKSYLISNTAIPKIQYAEISPSGNTIVFRYLDTDMKTEKALVGTLGSNNIEFLPDNIESVGFSGITDDIVYVRHTNLGSQTIIRDKNGKTTPVYDSGLMEWNAHFLGNDFITMTNKASEITNGYAYKVDKKTKTIKKIISEKAGLTTLPSPLGNYVLYSQTEKAGPVMYLYTVKDGTIRKINKMGMTEKCSFGGDDKSLTCAVPKAFDNVRYPDGWYQGIIETTDSIYRYTTDNLNERYIGDLGREVNGKFDTLKIDSDPSGQNIMLIRKTDMSLWIYED